MFNDIVILRQERSDADAESRSAMPRSKRKLLIIGTIVLALLAALGLGLADSRRLDVEHITAQFADLPPELEGFRIVQLSDWHLPNQLVGVEQLIAVVAAEQPDLIVMTGDMLDTSNVDGAQLQQLGEQLLAIAPTFAAPGNHELIGGGDWRPAYGVVPVLDDEYVDFGSWALAGTSYRHPMPQTPPGKFTILLAHRPDQYPANLTFSGHNHGGEWRLPGLGGLIGPDLNLFPQFTSGLYQHDDGTLLVVSRGLGDVIAPIRIGNRPHLVVVTLSQI